MNRPMVWRVASILMLLTPAIGQNTNYQADASWRAPHEAISRINPLAGRPQVAGGGRKLFLRNCSECHDKDGSGIVRKHSADLQLPVVQGQTDGALFWKITNGNPDRGMPSFSRLPELERWQLVLFLRTLKPVQSAWQRDLIVSQPNTGVTGRSENSTRNSHRHQQ
jgi:mono/diheme cytochrome c family protein